MKSISKNVLLRLVAQSEEADIRGNCKLASDITTQLTKLAIRTEKDNEKYSYIKDEMIEDVKDHLWAAVIRIMDYYEEVPDTGVIQELVDFEVDTFVESVENFIKTEIGKHEESVPGENEDVDEDSEEVNEDVEEVDEEEEIEKELEEDNDDEEEEDEDK